MHYEFKIKIQIDLAWEHLSASVTMFKSQRLWQHGDKINATCDRAVSVM